MRERLGGAYGVVDYPFYGDEDAEAGHGGGGGGGLEEKVVRESCEASRCKSSAPRLVASDLGKTPT